MDSDSKKKNLFGTIMKSAAFVTPYFLPGLGQWYALATAGLTAMSFLPQLGKMLGGFMEGDEIKKTDLYKTLYKTE
jgi:predicted phage tail protein